MRRNVFSVVFCLTGICLALCGRPADGFAQEAGAAPALRGMDAETVVVLGSRSDYVLGAGDKVRITVYDEDDLSGEFQVDTAGFVRLPLIGQIKAQGLTAHQLEAELKARYDRGYLVDARIAVEITGYRPIYVIGQVIKPGQFAYVSNMSVLDAIALAGGFSDKAVESSVDIRRAGATQDETVEPNQLVRIEPGDVVRVRETAFWSVADILSPLTPIGYVLATAGAL